jgi:hypothetical protein
MRKCKREKKLEKKKREKERKTQSAANALFCHSFPFTHSV